MIRIADPIDFDVLRVRHEFLALPDLRASVDRVAALLGVTPRHATLTLESLVSDGFLSRTPDRQYVRASGASPYLPASRAIV
jgi:Mn-dependent DtxR family transcriptional regulator